MTLRQFSGIVEMRTKIISISTYILGTLYVVYRTGRLDVLNAVLMFFAAVLIDMGTTAFNTFFDYLHGVDHWSDNQEEAKVLVHDKVPSIYALFVALGCFGLAALPGLFLTLRVGWPLLLVALGCMAVGFLYSGGPLPLSRTPLGEFFAGGTLGSTLFLLVFYVHNGAPDISAFLASLPSTFAIAAILTVNNTCDIQGDTRAGRRTLSIVLGAKGGALVALFEVAAAFLLLPVLGVWDVLPFWPGFVALPTFILALMVLGSMARRGYAHTTKEANMGGISAIFMLFTFSMVLSLVLGLFTQGL